MNAHLCFKFVATYLFVVAMLLLSVRSYEVDFDVVKAIDNLIQQNTSDPVGLAKKIRESEFAAIMRELKQNVSLSSRAGSVLPLVFLHGMGDSCFNNGMQSITEESGVYMGVYSTCIPTGDTRLADTINGFLLNMDANVDVFAEKVREDPNLANGFNCIGLSQGNNICRGYIQRYNDPVAVTHISIHGPIVGVASLPSCDPNGKFVGDLCRQIDEILGKAAYNQLVQSVLFQANYFREPSFVNTVEYKEYSQIAAWNNEGAEGVDENVKYLFWKTSRFAMIKALEDTVVIPNEGEWWASYDDSFKKILPMTETAWYTEDLFGLRTANEAGKV